jgi:hypothetical protein
MKRLAKKARAALENRKVENIWMIVASFVFLFLVVGYGWRGWFRMSVAPWAVTTFNRGNPAQKTAEKHIEQLQDPMKLLGFDSLEQSLMGCETDRAELLSTEVICTYSQRAWGKLPQDAESEQAQKADTQSLETLLKQNGWALEQDDSDRLISLPKLVNDVYAGTPQEAQTASYSKQDSDVLCYLTAYAIETSTKDPGIGATFSCSSWHYFFGKPHRGP